MSIKTLWHIALLSALCACEHIELSESTHDKQVSRFRDTCYIWNNHVVIGEQPTTKEIILLSLYEWGEMPSANHISDSAMVGMMTYGYQELELGQWHVPTTEEAKQLKAAYGENNESLERLNLLLRKAEALELHNDARYLCDEGQKSFSLASGTSIANAGSKIKTYRLRLLKRIEMH